MRPTVPRWGRGGGSPRDQRGAVTAEAALVLPLLVVVAAALAWIIGFGVVEVRVQDAAREAARVAARGESDAVARSAASQVAPSGSSIDLVRSDGTVVVTVATDLRPGGMLAFLPGPTARASAVAAEEGPPHALP